MSHLQLKETIPAYFLSPIPSHAILLLVYNPIHIYKERQICPYLKTLMGQASVYVKDMFKIILITTYKYIYRSVIFLLILYLMEKSLGIQFRNTHIQAPTDQKVGSPSSKNYTIVIFLKKKCQMLLYTENGIFFVYLKITPGNSAFLSNFAKKILDIANLLILFQYCKKCIFSQ